MAVTPFADAQDVEARWRTLTEAEMLIADTLCADASDIIRTRWPDVDARIASGALSADSLVRVTANMVKRAMLNADTEGLESRSRVSGPFGDTVRFANPSANLYLNAEDIRLLGGPAARRAFAVDLSSNVAPCGYYGV